MRGSLLRVRVRGLVLASCLVALTVLVSPSVVFAGGVCPNEAFRVGLGATLPDCRAYEMVTPVYKNSGDVTTESAIISLAPELSSDGQSVRIWSTASFSGAAGNTGTYGSPYLLSRTGSGWVTTPMELPESQFFTVELSNQTSGFLGGSVDGLSEALFARGVYQPSHTIDIYKTGPGGSVLDVGPALPPNAPSEGTADRLAVSEALHPVGVSADGSHVFFRLGGQAKVVYWPGDATQEGRKSLYEYAGTRNTTPMLVGVNNNGEQISKCGTTIGGAREPTVSGNGETEVNHNAVSADGSRVFFTTFACVLPVNEVYARVDSGLADAHTVAISEPSKQDCEACNTEPGVLSNGLFVGASQDGSKVFFTTTQPLLGEDTSENLYEYDFGAPAGHRIIHVSGGNFTVSDPTASVVGEPVQISEDGSHVYFVANGVLTKTANDQGQTAQGGALNMYVFERDAQYPEGHTSFIGALSGNDAQLWTISSDKTLASGGADSTLDGRFLVFSSAADLTPDDTSSVQQIFEYDSLMGNLARVSVGQNGYNSNGNTDVYPASIPSPDYSYKNGSEAVDPRAYWSHMAVSADGSYVFFASRDALATGASEEHAHEDVTGEQIYDNGPNVYEYHAGNVYLIAKASNTAEALISTDASGADVFIGSTESFVAQDTDTNGDIYDARIGGGFPAPMSAPGCSGDACQGSLSGAPVLLAPGSEFQAGSDPLSARYEPAVKSIIEKKKAKAKARKKKTRHKKAKMAGSDGRVRSRPTRGGK